MGFLTSIKHNTFIRGFYNLIDEYFGVRKNRLGHADKTVILIPPMWIEGHKNIYLYEHSHIDSHATILTTKARFIMEPWAGAAVGLTVITGNHHHIVGRLSHTITDAETRWPRPGCCGGRRCLAWGPCHFAGRRAYRQGGHHWLRCDSHQVNTSLCCSSGGACQGCGIQVHARRNGSP